jgi:hypothetical protein
MFGFVMFERRPDHAPARKFPKIEKNVTGMFNGGGCSNQRASV